MTSSDNQTPSEPRQRIELVSLFAPTVNRAKEPVFGQNRPPVNISPLPAWPAPSVRTTSHHGPRQPAPGVPALLAIAPRPAPVSPAIASAETPPVVEGIATAVREPKTPRPNAVGRPMAPNVAAAIERVTNNVTELRPREIPVPGTGLAVFDSSPRPGTEIELAADVIDLRPVRSRIEIVPLTSHTAHYVPSPPRPAWSPVSVGRDHEAEVIDLREPRGRRGNANAVVHTHACAACSTQGHIDIVDNVNGILHLSCSSCFRMWTEDVRQDSLHTDR